MITLSTLVGPWFVVYNKDYCDNNNENRPQDDRTETDEKMGGRISPTLKN